MGNTKGTSEEEKKRLAADASKRTYDIAKRYKHSATLSQEPYTFDVDPLCPPESIQSQDAEFVKDLEKNSQWATTSDVLRETINNVRKKNKLEIVDALPSLLRHPIRYDSKLVQERAELDDALSHPFTTIVAPKKSYLALTHQWKIKDQIKLLGDRSGQAYLPTKAVDVNGHSTHNVSADMLRSCFLPAETSAPEEKAVNFLDIANLTGYQFVPDAVMTVSLLHKIEKLQSQGSFWGRAGAMDKGGKTLQLGEGWMILTKGPTVSPFHVDHAGYCTAVVGLDGGKLWHVTKGDWESVRSTFHLRGPRYSGYADGVAKIWINDGDCLIQAPGTIHAVVTPDKAMLAGCFFYTAATFDRSIKCVRLGLQGRLHDNEDTSDADYDNLTLVVQHLMIGDLFTDQQRDDIASEILDLLIAQKAVELNTDEYIDAEERPQYLWILPPMKKAKSKAGSSVYKGPKSLHDFLTACYNFLQDHATSARA